MADELQRSRVTVDVWNRALARVGQTLEIADEAEDGVAASACRRHWLDVVGEALELRDWDFAKAQAALLPVPVGAERKGWEHAYRLPADLVAPRYLLQGDLRASLDPEETRISYELQMDDDGTGLLLVTDADLSSIDALEYTSNKASVLMWPRLFVSAVAFRLAAELALAVVKGREGQALHDKMMGYFQSFLEVSHARRTRAQVPDPDLDAPSIRARS